MKNTLILALLALFAPTAEAGGSALSGMSCNNTIIQTGMLMVEVLDKCGEPDLRERFSTRNGNSTCWYEEQWAYRPKHGGRLTTLIFKEGKLDEIKYSDH